MMGVAHDKRCPMKIVFSPDHQLHHGRGELTDGRIMPCHERPARVDIVAAAVSAAGFPGVSPPHLDGRGAMARTHDADYLAFLEAAWATWEAEHAEPGRDTPDALPLIWPVRNLRAVRPRHIDGLISYHALDAGTPVTAGTWRAVTAAAACAASAADLVCGGQGPALSMARPPGHHATKDQLGGYCYLNNAAIAVHQAQARGADRVAVLDVDYHHGNGTQAIFEDRSDVLVVNLHADPRDEFPYFLGHADETGIGAGEGATVNMPMPFGTAWDTYGPALDAACAHVAAFAPDLLVLSWGFDTFEGDPISHFKLTTEDFARIGARVAKLGLPTAIILEGGYAVDDLGRNVVSGLTGFLDG